MILSLSAMALGMVSCEKENKEKELEESDSIVLNTDKEWTTSDLSAYVGDISVLPQDLQTVISQRFPKKTGLENATVIFAGASDMTANADKIANALEGGAFLVTPAGVDLSPLGANPFLDPDSVIDLTPLLYCYSSWGDDLYYVMYDEPEVTEQEEGTPSMSEEEWKELVRLNEDMDDYIGTSMTDYDNDPAHNENYFQTRMDPFVDWLDAAYKGRNFLNAHTMWVWHVPSSVVKDRDTRQFRLNTSIYLEYATWYHWRGAVRYDSNRKNHGITIPSKSWTLEAPARTPWGFIRLKNATNNEMAHVSFYDDKGGLITTLTTSYSKGEEARIALVEGTYSVTWDIVNGDTGEVLSSWIYRNVKVHQGGNDDEATVRISTVDGEKTN